MSCSPKRFRFFAPTTALLIALAVPSTGHAFCPGPVFGTQTQYTVGARPHGATLADFNNDGILDLAACLDGHHTIGVRLGQGSGGVGDGTFGPLISPEVGGPSLGLTTGDFNEDGNVDIAIADAMSQVAILLGFGNGTFQGAQFYYAPGRPFAIVAADFNEDGITDLAVPNNANSNISVLLGIGSGGVGNGTFDNPLNFALSDFSTGIAVADLDEDGILDIVATENYDGQIAVLLGLGTAGVGNGTFASALHFPATGEPFALAIADFNEDGDLDIAAGDAAFGGVAILLGNGSGSFAAPVIYRNGTQNAGLEVGDYNHDGILDIATGDGRNNVVAVLLGNGTNVVGDGTFGDISTYPAGATSFPLTSGDLNEDSAIDVIAANETGTTVSTFLGTCTTPIAPPGPPPTISSFTPTAGAPGAVVTIIGTHLTNTVIVRFSGLDASFTPISDTEIHATVPSGAHTGPIRVITTEGNVTSASAFVVSPKIDSFHPGQAPIGEIITIVGYNFAQASAVGFNGSSASFTIVNDTEIRATVPSGATDGPIEVTNPGGSGVSSQNFHIGPLPQITSFTPTAGMAGVTVTVVGNGFTGASEVRFNAVGASFSFIDDGELRATVPIGAHSGRISVDIPGATLVSPDSFIVAPQIASFDPTQAPEGHIITIHGRDFVRTTSVSFNGLAAAFTLVSDVEIRAAVPTGVTDGPISVTNPGGTGTSSTIFHVGPLPRIDSFAPTAGAPGLVVTIMGVGFNDASSVRFLNTPAPFSVISNAEIHATVPSAARTGPITVVTLTATVVSDSAFIVAPVITSFSPVQAPAGHLITIRGDNFTRTSSVAFNGVGTTFDAISDDEIHATVPAGATDGPITVTNPGGSDVSDRVFYVGPLQALGGAMNLSWDDCGLAGAQNQSFACNTNVGAPFTLVASYRPPAGVEAFLGISAQIDITASTATLPDWWKFNASQCRGNTALSASFDFTAGPFSCTDVFLGQAAGGLAYDVGFGSPNRARLRVQAAIPFDQQMPLDEATEYYALKTVIQRSKSTGTGACAGCEQPMCIVLNTLQLFQPPDRRFDPIIETTLDRAFVTWQGSVAQCPLSTPVQAALVTADARIDRVLLVWDAPGLEHATLYRREGARAWSALASLVPDGTHRMTYEDREVTPGSTYDYRLGIQVAAGEVYAAETQVTVPAAHAELGLARVTSNGGRGVMVSFSLASAAPATLEIFDLAGRRRAQQRLEGFTAGAHEIQLTSAALHPGVYFARLTQQRANASRRFVLIP